MTIRSPSRIALAMRSAALVRPGRETGLCRAARVGRRNCWQSDGSAWPRVSRIWAISGLVLSRAARSAANSCGGAMFQRLGRCIRGLLNGRLYGSGCLWDDGGERTDPFYEVAGRRTTYGGWVRQVEWIG